MAIDDQRAFSDLVEEFIDVGHQSVTLMAEMDKIIQLSRRRLAESRELIAKIDALLERDALSRRYDVR